MNKGVRENLRVAVAKNKRINLGFFNGGNLKGKAEALTYRTIKIQTEEGSVWVPIREIESVSNVLRLRISGTAMEQEGGEAEAGQIAIRRIKEAIAKEDNPKQLRALAELLMAYLDMLDLLD